MKEIPGLSSVRYSIPRALALQLLNRGMTGCTWQPTCKSSYNKKQQLCCQTKEDPPARSIFLMATARKCVRWKNLHNGIASESERGEGTGWVFCSLHKAHTNPNILIKLIYQRITPFILSINTAGCPDSPSNHLWTQKSPYGTFQLGGLGASLRILISSSTGSQLNVSRNLSQNGVNLSDHPVQFFSITKDKWPVGLWKNNCMFVCALFGITFINPRQNDWKEGGWDLCENCWVALPHQRKYACIRKLRLGSEGAQLAGALLILSGGETKGKSSRRLRYRANKNIEDLCMHFITCGK